MTSSARRAKAVQRATSSSNVLKAATAEERKVRAILERARQVRPSTQTTPSAMAANAKLMKRLRNGSERAFSASIRRGDLITKRQLLLRLGGEHVGFDAALHSGRLFSLPSSSGIEYFPAFFADKIYDQHALHAVVHTLAGLPGASKYFFFVHKSTRLQATALEALAQGRTTEVLECARAFMTG